MQVAGFTTDIGAVPDDLNLAVSLFFITFVVLQPPSAAVGRWLGAKHWIPIMMVRGFQPKHNPTKILIYVLTHKKLGWGLVTLGQAFIKGRGTLLLILCIAELSNKLIVVRFPHYNPPPDRRFRSRLLPHRRRLPFVLLLPI